MYLIQFFFIIALYHYNSIAAKNTPVDLDIHTREDTNQVKVTKIENKSMVTYKIEPKRRYKIGKFVDGDKIILDPKQDEGFIYLEVKYSTTNDNVIIVTLVRPQKFFAKIRHNSICICNGFKSCFKASTKSEGSDLEMSEKVKLKHLKYHEIVFISDNKYPILDKQDAKRKYPKEEDVQSCVYRVSENTGIFRVMYGSTVVWQVENDDEVYACCCVTVYYFGESPEFLMLIVMNSADLKSLHYRKSNKNGKYNLIEKGDFNIALMEMAELWEMKIEFAKERVEVDISYNESENINVNGVKKYDYEEDDIEITTFAVDEKTVISKVKTRNIEIWERAEGEYGCYKVRVYYYNRLPHILILTIKCQNSSEDLYFYNENEKYSSIKKEQFDIKLKLLKINVSDLDKDYN